MLIFPFYPGSIHIVHRTHNQSDLHWMPIPAVHVVPAPAKRLHFFLALHEFLHQIVSIQADCNEKNRIKKELLTLIRNIVRRECMCVVFFTKKKHFTTNVIT